ncbi:MAG: M23 family metallopeptidase [Chitinophagaceae bacterium]|nr:M23 family metallopeptidase [Chitinophagaceae bacterium]
MKHTHKLYLFSIFLLAHSLASAQVFPVRNYPRDYFIYPVKGVRISLAANFGELRPNHYHMGLDCRTDQAVNKTVVAAADGYIARISVAPLGFGQAIYINHPNGLTTVYGHLNRFFDALEDYVISQQYAQETWAINLEFRPDQFPVKKGQFIALSGSTGGSAGPHVHFEIRDTKTDKVLNPLLFNLPVPDKVPPTIVRLYMYDRCKSTYSQTPLHIPIRYLGNGKYVAVQKLITVHTDKISFGITANDKQSFSHNPNGIYEGILYVDNQPQNGFRIDSISYDETRYVNAHIDYKTRAAGGPYIEHLSRLPGYPQGVYTDFRNDGVIDMKDDLIHPVRIVVRDADGNTSVLEFNIQKGLIRETGEKGDPNDPNEFKPGMVNIFEDNQVQLYLNPDALYDSVRFFHQVKDAVSKEAVSPVVSILSGLIPVESFFTIRLKANRPVSDPGKVLVRRSWKGKSEVVKATRDGDWYSSKFRAFGDFELVVDNEPPVIKGGFANHANLSKSRSIVFVPEDNFGEIKNFRAELDGKWLRFTNDKGRSFIYHFDEHCSRGAHKLVVSVEDEAGNRTERTYFFTR